MYFTSPTQSLELGIDSIMKELLFTGSQQMLNHRVALAPLHWTGKDQFLVSSIVCVAPSSPKKCMLLPQGERKKIC